MSIPQKNLKSSVTTDGACRQQLSLRGRNSTQVSHELILRIDSNPHISSKSSPRHLATTFSLSNIASIHGPSLKTATRSIADPASNLHCFNRHRRQFDLLRQPKAFNDSYAMSGTACLGLSNTSSATVSSGAAQFDGRVHTSASHLHNILRSLHLLISEVAFM
jgi:hypothetical protein